MKELIKRYPALSVCESDIADALTILKEVCDKGGKVLICGNGGSAADSEHITGELMKSFVRKRGIEKAVEERLYSLFPEEGLYLARHLEGAIPAIALTGQIALSTAYANDTTPDMVFAQQAYGYGKVGDVLLGLSTSGNSKNVINAMKVAKAKKMRTIGFTGTGPSQMDEICDVTIRVPEKATYKVQEYHLPIYHYLCMQLEAHVFGE